MTTLYTRLPLVMQRIRRPSLVISLTFALFFALSNRALAQPIVHPIDPPEGAAGETPITFHIYNETSSAQETEAIAAPSLSAPNAWEATTRVFLPRVVAESTEFDVANRASVVNAYVDEFESPIPPMDWTGDYPACIAGSTSNEYIAATVERINFYRAMAGVPEDVVLHAPYMQQAQAAALMMSVNGQLSHSPSADWHCYSEAGAKAAGAANLASAPGPQAIDLYMHDSGSGNAAVGHRRWLLLPQLQRIGAGSTPNAQSKWGSNVLYVLDPDSIWAARPPVRDGFVAWPPRGYVPYTLVPMRWSLSLPDADFSRATVTMHANGNPIAVTKEPLHGGFGEETLVWIPQIGANTWPRPADDTAFTVTVANVRAGGENQTITYTVHIIDPG